MARMPPISCPLVNRPPTSCHDSALVPCGPPIEDRSMCTCTCTCTCTCPCPGPGIRSCALVRGANGASRTQTGTADGDVRRSSGAETCSDARPPPGKVGRRSNGEGGIRTLDGGIHPHNALAGRRLQPLGHFSAGPRRIADLFPITPSGGGKGPPGRENEHAGSPLIPPASETRLRLSEAGFPFPGRKRPGEATARTGAAARSAGFLLVAESVLEQRSISVD
jgi:hypothetical protein